MQNANREAPERGIEKHCPLILDYPTSPPESNAPTPPETVQQFLAAHLDEALNFIKIPNAEWKAFRVNYSKEHIKQELAKFIIENNLEFPFKPIDLEDVKTLFNKFVAFTPRLTYPSYVTERVDYKNKYSDKPLGVIGKSHVYNSVSNYYQQKNRLACGSIFQPAPLEIWNDQSKLEKMNWHFWRDGVLEKSDIDHKSFRSAFRLGTYTSTQFKPAVAKLMYQMHNATSVIDFSCGWGDRLAAFYATPKTKYYLGCDPNPETFEMYKKQCMDYERFLGTKNPHLHEGKVSFQCTGKKIVVIFNCAAEDIDWSQIEPCHDLVFTSPPYFETEKYGQGGKQENLQSWFRYNTFEEWRDKFLFNILEKVWGCVKPTGYMAINIVDPSSGNKRLPLCDDMVDFCTSLAECNYIGKIMMELRARPHTNLTEIVGEPIWMFKKSDDKYFRSTTLNEFFSC